MLPIVAYSVHMKITGRELRDARSLKDLTQSELAEKLGVSQRTIVNWEASSVPEKSVSRVRRLLGPELASGESWKAYLDHLESPEGKKWLEQEAAAAEQYQAAAIESEKAHLEWMQSPEGIAEIERHNESVKDMPWPEDDGPDYGVLEVFTPLELLEYVIARMKRESQA